MKHHNHQLQIVVNLVKNKQCDDALNLVNKLIANGSVGHDGFQARAFVNECCGRLVNAVDDLTKAIELCPNEVHYYYQRGICRFKLSRFSEAELDFTTVLELSALLTMSYYTTGAYFFRADCRVRMGQWVKAMEDCRHVPDDFEIWTDRLRCKAEIVGECAGLR